MIPKKKDSSEEEEIKHSQLTAPKPQYVGFQPYRIAKMERQESFDHNSLAGPSITSSSNDTKKTRKR